MVSAPTAAPSNIGVLVGLAAAVVFTIVFAGYVSYLKVKEYDKDRDTISMSSLAVFSLAAFDFYSDIFFALSAFQSERPTVSTLGIVMIIWLVVVFAVNGILLVQVGQKHKLALENKENGRPFDEAHSGTYVITALLTLTSAELIAAFPWEGAQANGFPNGNVDFCGFWDNSVDFWAECAGYLEDLPQVALQIAVYTQGGAEGDLGWLVVCTAMSVVTVIVRVVLRRLLGGQATQVAAKVAPVGPVVSASVWRDPNAPPEYWDEVSDRFVAERFTVKPGSDEYGRVSKAFMLTLDRGQFTIHSIERVQNMELWETYAPKMSSILAHEKDEEARKKMVRNWLFHGCPSDVVPKIVQQGFNRSFCGANATLYGKGVYFARDASYSTYPKYCRPDSEGIQSCFLVRAVVGEFCKANEDDRTPGVRDADKNILYDSTVDNLQNPSIFVLYHDAQTYPEYIVRFSQTWDPDNPKPHPRAGLPAHPNYRPNMLDQSTLARQMSWRAWA